MATHHKKLSKCPNCDTPLRLHDNFCPNCGQENHELKVPFSHLFSELFETLFHFETKFFTTLKVVFTRPGQITRDFWNGKRARYMHPFRLYVFVSVLFFLIANKFADKQVNEIDTVIRKIGENQKIVELKDLVFASNQAYYDSLAGNPDLEDYWGIDLSLPIDSANRRSLIQKLKISSDIMLDSLLTTRSIARTTENRNKLRSALNRVPDASNIPIQMQVRKINFYFSSVQERDIFTNNLKRYSIKQLDSTLVKVHVEPTALNRTLLRQVSKFDLEDETVLQNLTHVVMKNLSVAMFILMPLVALLLLWFFHKQKGYYFEHLIFSIHAHTILFIVFSLAITINYFFAVNWLIPFVLLLNWIYFFLSLKRVYEQGWIKTLPKFLILTIVYLVIVGSFLTGAFAWGVLTF